MRLSPNLFWLVLFTLSCLTPQSLYGEPSSADRDATIAQKPIEGLIVEPDKVTQKSVADWKKEGFDTVVLVLDERFEPVVLERAVETITSNSINLYYWIEVGRNPALANAHPEWMAALGSHDDWRQQFPDVRPAVEGEVVKAWPWVPIAYRDAFHAHLRRIAELLRRAPANYRGLLLNDLQGGPSACGCGNLQCRWAIDYGVASTTENTDPDAAAKFVAEVRRLAPGKQVIPVWTTECEREDLTPKEHAQQAWHTSYCGSVDCFDYCRDRFTEQWTSLHAARSGPTGILALHKEFRRDRKEYGPSAGWITYAVKYLDALPKPIPHEELWLVVQGYDVTAEQAAAARQTARRTGAGGVLLARARIDQSYELRVIRSP